MSTVHFILDGYWYMKFISGEKTIEYRKITPYWTKRLTGKTITHGVFRYGYSKISFTRKIKRIDIGPCPYPGWIGDYYRIHLETKDED